jgi:hypothetical protein
LRSRGETARYTDGSFAPQFWTLGVIEPMSESGHPIMDVQWLTLGVGADLHVPLHCLNPKKSKGLGNVWAECVV